MIEFANKRVFYEIRSGIQADTLLGEMHIDNWREVWYILEEDIISCTNANIPGVAAPGMFLSFMYG